MTRIPRLSPRAVLSTLAAFVVTASLLVAFPVAAHASSATTAAVSSPATATSATANITDGFDAGYIISDANFTNVATMTQNDIQTFLNGKVTSCRTGYTCLKDYRQTSTSRSADSYCRGYTGTSNETAASIIYKVSQSCGINPQVFLVMLQKEQGLVTHTWPSAWRYSAALGQGCPDTAACDPTFQGLFNQIYGAGRQMKIYMEGRYFTYYPVGSSSNILYNPNSGCGRAPVAIRNVSTAALYYYTPYQPNAAALRAGYGEGDSCSAYGNRNFYNYYKDWFGSPNGDTSGSPAAIAAYWQANGGAAGWIGSATGSAVQWGSSGWAQTFQNATIYSRPSGAAFSVTGATRTEYTAVGGPASGLAWPSSDRVAISGGYYQDFEGGRIYEKAGAAYAVASPVFPVHEGLGNVFGRFGWPTSRATAVAGGAVQTFEGGTVYQPSRSVASAYALSTPWATWYTKNGGPTGSLGFPGSGESRFDAATVIVAFQNATVFLNGTTYLRLERVDFDAYKQAETTGTPLGRPTSAVTTITGGRQQTFTGGAIYRTSSGTYAVSALYAQVAKAGGIAKTGLPTAAAVTDGNGNVSQRFANMTLTSSGVVVKGAIRSEYERLGGAASSLGVPKAAEKAVSGSYYQDFTGGRIVVTSAVTTSVTTETAKAWDALGGPTGRLGWPTVATYVVSGVNVTEFGGDVMFHSPGKAAYAVYGVSVRTYRQAGGTPVLGAPIANEVKTDAGYTQQFAKGVIFVPFAGTASAVANEQFREYTNGGSLNGFGFALDVARPVGIGRVQPFQTGTIATSSLGTAAVRGTMRVVHDNAGGYTGPLGFPVAAERKVGSGFVQDFQGGTTYVSPRALAVTRGVLHREYMKAGGPAGTLGWPLGDETSGNGTWTQKFDNGSITLYADGRVVVG